MRREVINMSIINCFRPSYLCYRYFYRPVADYHWK